MTKNEIISILQKYRHGEELTAQEDAMFRELFVNEDITLAALEELLVSENQVSTYNAERWEPVLMQILSVDKAVKTGSFPSSPHRVHRVHFLRKWWWAAAAILFVIGVGAYLFNPSTPQNRQEAAATDLIDVGPGTNGAILTLADGRKVILDSMGNGLVASERGANVVLQNGQLTYDRTGNVNGEMVYNTISTPRGRQFRITLPDATQVWLNAESSIRFPTVFSGAARHVQITGEVYFEVNHNNKPFRVAAEKALVEVLGTHFNVNAYANESGINTTLLQGSVRVMQDDNARKAVVIQPGQQAQISQSGSGEIKVIDNANIDKIIAWKNGAFNFEGSGIKEVMRQLERWYDIKVEYKNTSANFIFRGGMYRNVNLSDVLDVLKEMGVKYEWNGKTLTIF
jgi:transmembrane sensor